MKTLTKQQQGKVNNIQDKEGKCLTEVEDKTIRWTEYCSELYTFQNKGDTSVLTCHEPTEEGEFPILRQEVESAIKTLKCGKAAGVDNVPAELITHSGQPAVDVLHAICIKIWETGKWPSTWTKSIIITIPKKGNLQLCNNYRTISLMSHGSKVMLKIILNRLRPLAENIIAEEQAGFRRGRSTIEQIFNLRILCEKHLQHQRNIYHVFIDFKKAFDRVWHEALWATMKKFNISGKLIETIQSLYENAMSAVLVQGTTGEWFHTSVGVRQGCLLSPTLFNIFLEGIIIHALENFNGTISIGGRKITNLRFADDIDGITGEEDELTELVHNLDTAAEKFGMEISAEKTKIMTNNGTLQRDITIQGQKLETVNHFKYLGAIICDEGSRREVLSRAAQTMAALARLKIIWKDKNIRIKHKIRLMRALVMTIFLYACETWTLTAELQRRIQALEFRCFRKILGISYKDRVINEHVRETIVKHIGPYEDLLATVKRRKLKWYGHVTRSDGLSKVILQGTVEGSRRRGRPKKSWSDNIAEWTGKSFAETQAMAHNRQEWRELTRKSIMMRPYGSSRS